MGAYITSTLHFYGQNDLLTYIKRRLAPQPVKIRADIEVTCFTYEGIDAIKAALTEGEEKGAFPDTYCMRPSKCALPLGVRHAVDLIFQ
jgi:hypothetical protein